MPHQYSPKDVARFWSKVDRFAGPHACWPWLGARTNRGYGHLKIKGKMVKANRMAWEIANDEMLGDLLACHHCDNRGCCNPAHIFSGTTIDNMRDRDAKGRTGMPYSRLKLNQAAADRIRAIYQAGGVTHADLATEFGVAEATIYKVLHGLRWSHS